MGIKDYWKNASPERLEERRRKIGESVKKTHELKKARQAEIMAKAEEFLPRIIAEEILMADDQKYVPSQKTINKLKELLADSGKTIEQIRKSMFRDMSDNGWAKLMKYAFKSHISQIEDVGVELVRARQNAIDKLKAHIVELSGDLEKWKEKNKSSKKSVGTHLGLKSMILRLEERLFELEKDFAQTLHSIGAVGQQSKSPSFHIHLGTPRPPKAEPQQIDPTTVDITNDGHRD